MEVFLADRIARFETAGHSSKGNQLKWKDGDFWYKADYMGYEGLAEVVVAAALKESNCRDFAMYEPTCIHYRGNRFGGCRSRNFLGEQEELITAERLYRQFSGRSFASELAKIPEVKGRVNYFVENVEEITGLREFGPYLTMALEMDAFFLNEDRHTNNIAVIYRAEEDQYDYCPYFDHGLTLFSDTKQDFPLARDAGMCRKQIVAKPFSRDFDEQMDAAEELFGRQLKFFFDVDTFVKNLKVFREIYGEDVCRRVETVIRQQTRKYSIFF